MNVMSARTICMLWFATNMHGAQRRNEVLARAAVLRQGEWVRLLTARTATQSTA